ncbi:MAG: AbrB/MazE/SpoVT family DNA-binding domain-containing protein [Proteobacteria bacterium]|nr:AbrB/MazE/SpoVT family DNA-binding domain-containing protein [Pseudomonadota bacterium]
MTTLTSKGQVTIPKPVRERLGVKPGDEVAVDMTTDGRVTIAKVKARAKSSRFATLRGHAGKGMTTDQIMALTRGS